MIDGVAQEVNERVLHLLDDALVHLDLAAADDQLGLFALVAREIPDDAGQDLEERRDGEHEELLGILEQRIDHPRRGAAVVVGRFHERRQSIPQRPHVLLVPLEEIREAGQ